MTIKEWKEFTVKLEKHHHAAFISQHTQYTQRYVVGDRSSSQEW